MAGNWATSKKSAPLMCAVALRIARMQAVGVDGSVDARLVRLGLVEIDGAGDGIEFPSHVGDHHVPHLETGGAVLRVDLISHCSVLPKSRRGWPAGIGIGRFLDSRRLHRPRAWDPAPAQSATAIRAFHRRRYSGRAGSASAPPPNPTPRSHSQDRRSSPYRRATAGFPCSVPDPAPFAWIGGSAPSGLGGFGFLSRSRFGRFGLGSLEAAVFAPSSGCLGTWPTSWRSSWPSSSWRRLASWQASPPTAPARCSARER